MSRYENYEIKNNVFGTLSTPISSLATSIQLGDGQGQRFSENMLATLENIENGKVMKREIVLITAINGDTLTVTRKYAPCPANDEANTQGQVSYAFSTDDTISAYIDKEHFDELDKSINDIYDNGVNKLRTEVISGLQIKVNAGPVLVGSSYYNFEGGNLTLTDNATNYLEIDEDGLLVNNTTGRNDENTKLAIITTASGEVINIQDWRLGTIGGKLSVVNIHDLTEKENLDCNDEFILSDSEAIFQNKKIKAGNLLGVGETRAMEDILKGDILYYESTPSKSESETDFSCIGYNIIAQKSAIKRVLNGDSFSSIEIILGKVGNPVNNLNIRIESDNNGSPSGNLIDENAYATILYSDIGAILQEKTISFQDEISVAPGICWIVLDFGTYDSNNYFIIGGKITNSNIFSVKSFDGLNWNNYESIITDYYTPTTTNLQSWNAGMGYVYAPCLSADGTKLYIRAQSGSGYLYEYTLSTPRDISNPTYVTRKAMGETFTNIHFNPDGTKLYLGANNLRQFTLSTPRDITTATYNGQISGARSISFSSDGTKAILQNSGLSYMNATLSTPRDITTATTADTGYVRYENQRGVWVSQDGLTMYAMESSAIVKYSMTTPRDSSTKSVVTITSLSGANGGLYITPNGESRFYTTNFGNSSSPYGTIRKNQCYIENIFGEKTASYIGGIGFDNKGVSKANAIDQIPFAVVSSTNNFDSGNIVKYRTDISVQSGLTIGQKYYLSDTPGEIQTTPGTNEFEVGIAIEPTILKLKQTY